MTDRPAARRPDGHADHDPTLVAALAAGDDGADADAGAVLIAQCRDCAALHHDLVAIASATRSLPARARPRDFRLTPEQAHANRPQSWRRLLLPFAFGSRRALSGGAMLVTLGLAGLLFALLPGTPGETFRAASEGLGIPALQGPKAPAPTASAGDVAAGGGPATAAPERTAGPMPSATPCPSPDLILGPLSCMAPGIVGGGDAAAVPSGAPSASPGPTASDGASRLARDDRPLIFLSVMVLVAGVVLVALVALARRLRVDGGGP